LSPNREQNRKHETECFGIYRPTFNSTKIKLGNLAIESADSITSMLAGERERFALLKPKKDFAITVAKYGNIQRRIANAIISGYEIGRLVDTLSDDVLLDPLELTIKEIDWFQFLKKCKDARVLVLKFEENDNFLLMAEQFNEISRSLAKIGIYGAVNEPKNIHVTLLNYGEYGDRMRMFKGQANKAIEIAVIKRRANNSGKVHIGPLVIGDCYRSNHSSIHRRMESYVREF
jgi:2'-5' RNA ligase